MKNTDESNESNKVDTASNSELSDLLSSLVKQNNELTEVIKDISSKHYALAKSHISLIQMLSDNIKYSFSMEKYLLTGRENEFINLIDKYTDR